MFFFICFCFCNYLSKWINVVCNSCQLYNEVLHHVCACSEDLNMQQIWIVSVPLRSVTVFHEFPEWHRPWPAGMSLVVQRLIRELCRVGGLCWGRRDDQCTLIDDRAQRRWQSRNDGVVPQLNWIINPRCCRRRPVSDAAPAVNQPVDKTTATATEPASGCWMLVHPIYPTPHPAPLQKTLHRLFGQQSSTRRIRVISWCP